MPSQLDISDVTVAVMSVEVKALRIGKRQVTQSVFRQLPKKSLIKTWDEIVAQAEFMNCENDVTAALTLNNDLSLFINGEPWGKINYTWKGCCEEKEDRIVLDLYMDGEKVHDHIVWSSEGMLFRDCIFRVKNFGHETAKVFRLETCRGTVINKIYEVGRLKEVEVGCPGYVNYGIEHSCPKHKGDGRAVTEHKKSYRLANNRYRFYSNLHRILMNDLEQLFIAT